MGNGSNAQLFTSMSWLLVIDSRRITFQHLYLCSRKHKIDYCISNQTIIDLIEETTTLRDIEVHTIRLSTHDRHRPSIEML